GALDCHSHEPVGVPSSGWTLGKKMIRVSGHLAWRIYDKREKMSAAVSASGTPEFLAISQLGISAYFSHYNAPVMLSAPRAGDGITSLPPLPKGSVPLAGRLVRADGLTVGTSLLRGLTLAVSRTQIAR